MKRKALAVTLFCGLIARADVVELGTGEKVEGRFKQASDAGVVIEVAGQPVTIAAGKVRAIYFGSAPAVAVHSEDSTFKDALDALTGLRSVTSAPISLREYAPRVLDAKVKVDRYLNASAEGPSRTAFAVAMDYYTTAAQAWSAAVTRDGPSRTAVGEKLISNAAFADCAPLRDAIQDAERRSTRVNTQTVAGIKPMPPARGETVQDEIRHTTANFTASTVGGSPGILWKCAADKISQAQ